MSPSLFNIVRPDLDQSGNLFKQGDCGVIIRADGTFQAFSCDIDAAELQKPDGERSAEATQLLNNGRKLMALLLALSNQQVMDVLLGMTADPDIIDPNVVSQLARPN